jgi:TPR repeat protein
MIQKPRLSTAFDAFKEKDYDETVKQFKDQANRGDPVAQYNLGIIYETGVGGYRDDEMAEGYYRKAARSGDAEAQLQLATIIGGDVLLHQSQSSGNQPAQSCIILVLINHIQSFIGGFFWQWNR